MLTMVSAVTHHLSPYNIIMVLLTIFPYLISGGFLWLCILSLSDSIRSRG